VARVIRMRAVATSRSLLDELEATFRRKFKSRRPQRRSSRRFASWFVVELAPLKRPVYRDPDDDIVLVQSRCSRPDCYRDW
jgi:hypothetical protein